MKCMYYTKSKNLELICEEEEGDPTKGNKKRNTMMRSLKEAITTMMIRSKQKTRKIQEFKKVFNREKKGEGTQMPLMFGHRSNLALILFLGPTLPLTFVS